MVVSLGGSTVCCALFVWERAHSASTPVCSSPCQVRYLGLLENIRVKRAGYAFRLEYKKFLERYKMLCPATWPVYKQGARQGAKLIVQHCGLSKVEYAEGRSQMLIRSPER